MRKTKHSHFHPPLPSPKAPFPQWKVEKVFIYAYTHTLNKMYTIILCCNFQRYHTTSVSITLNKCPPLKKISVQPFSNSLVKTVSYGISSSTQWKNKRHEAFPSGPPLEYTVFLRFWQTLSTFSKIFIRPWYPSWHYWNNFRTIRHFCKKMVNNF